MSSSGTIPVLFVHNSGHLAGANRSLLRLFGGLAPTQWRPVSVLPCPGPMEAELRALEVPHAIVPFPRALREGPARGLSIISRLARMMLAHRIVLVHANDPLAYRHASLAAAILRIPAVCYLGLPTRPDVLRWSFRRAPRAVVACSDRLARDTAAILAEHQPDVAVHFVRAGVDTVTVAPPTELAALRQRLDLPADDPVVSIVGAVSERKGHPLFLAAARELIPRFPRARFLVVGDDHETGGVYREAMERHAVDLGVARSVRFVGFQNPVEPWIGASDLIVLPSYQEGLPQALVEAHAMGKPVVATDVDGIAEVVETGITGLLVPPGDAAALTRALAALLDDPARCRAMGVAARQRAVAHFDLAQSVTRMTEIYRACLGPARAVA